MQQITLNGTWTLTYGPQNNSSLHHPPADWPSIDATVPGNVEIDLMHAGVLPELSIGNNIQLLRETEGYEWWYQRTFTTPVTKTGQRVELVFDGLDCIADIWLNDSHLGRTNNMLIPHHFDVTQLLRPLLPGQSSHEANTLVVRIHSAVLEGRKYTPEPLGLANGVNWESINVRKAPHCYGWDIMPRAVSAGLWRSVSLQIIEPTHWRSVYWSTLTVDAQQRQATLLVDWDFASERFYIDTYQVRATINGVTTTYPVLGTHGRARIHLSDIDLWWPRGYGQPALYAATLELIDGEGNVLDTNNTLIGLRVIKLDYTSTTSPDKPGEFVFVVNGERIFVKGTNWVPLDALHSRDAQHLDAAMAMIAELNCNMIRCWGGNVYEDHAFFDHCDRLGVMVWQDFALACAIYPQTDDFAAVIRQEAESVVTKLRNHPSLALWAGNNEIDESYEWLGMGVDPNTDRLSREVLPAVVRRLDPLRAYLPSSPYSSPEYVQVQKEVNRLPHPYNAQPEQHLWGPRNDFKSAFYTGSPAHFASEIGYHGCPDPRSMTKFLEPDYLWPWQNNDQWLTHATRPLPGMTDFNYRIELMGKQIGVLFDALPDNLDDYALASQISQAEAKKFFIEWFRQGKWRRTGILWWNLRDGWPVISDAIVDYYGQKKLAYEYIRRVQTDVCVICCEARNGYHAVVAVNDTQTIASGYVRILDVDTGKVMMESEFLVPANGSAVIGMVAQATIQQMWLIDYRITDSIPMRNHYLAGPRPYTLSQYRRWLDNLDIPTDVGPVRK